VIVILFIYLPVFFLVLLSFKTGSSITFPIQGLTLDWYVGQPSPYRHGSEWVSVMYDARFFEAFRSSAYVSIAAGLLTCFIATATALALRRKVRGRDVLFYLILLGFIVPGVTLGLGLVFLYRLLGWEFTFWTPVIVDVIYAVPFGLVLVMARFEPRLMDYERAGSVLKAGPWKVFRHVTLPLIIWEVVSAGLFGFVLAWGEVIRTQFVMHGTGLLSTYILTEVGVHALSPKWYAVGTIVSMISFVALVIFSWTLQRGTRLKR
jgi:putative spermidine/putrescine transport system permease protein